MSTTTARDKAIEFFLEHAGYSYDPKTETPETGRRRCAERLADAEAWARENDLRVDWELEDEDPRDVFGEFCTADPCENPHCALVHGNPNAPHYRAVLRGAGKHAWHAGRFTGAVTCAHCGLLPLDDEDTDSTCVENQVTYAILGMIEDPTREYRRVIEAELALEAMPKTEVA